MIETDSITCKKNVEVKCYRCNKLGHYAYQCPKSGKNKAKQLLADKHYQYFLECEELGMLTEKFLKRISGKYEDVKFYYWLLRWNYYHGKRSKIITMINEEIERIEKKFDESHEDEDDEAIDKEIQKKKIEKLVARKKQQLLINQKCKDEIQKEKTELLQELNRKYVPDEIGGKKGWRNKISKETQEKLEGLKGKAIERYHNNQLLREGKVNVDELESKAETDSIFTETSVYNETQIDDDSISRSYTLKENILGEIEMKKKKEKKEGKEQKGPFQKKGELKNKFGPFQKKGELNVVVNKEQKKNENKNNKRAGYANQCDLGDRRSIIEKEIKQKRLEVAELIDRKETLRNNMKLYEKETQMKQRLLNKVREIEDNISKLRDEINQKEKTLARM